MIHNGSNRFASGASGVIRNACAVLARGLDEVDYGGERSGLMFLPSLGINERIAAHKSQKGRLPQGSL